MNQQTIRTDLGIWTLATAMVLTAGAAARADVCGDLNGDGAVNWSDGGIILADLGCTGGECSGDVDGDGDTDQQDLAWHLTFQECGPYPPYPQCGPCEPIGEGTFEIELVQVDNSHVGPGSDPGHPEFNGGVTHFTFDLVGTVTADNDWTTQYSSAELVHPEVAFFNHDFASDTEPNSAMFATFPAQEFDSFYAAPPELFDQLHPGFGMGPRWTDTSAETLWFDSSREDDYIATTQRFTLIVPEGMAPTVHADDCQFEVLARVSTDATAASTGSDLHHYDFVIVDLAQPLCPEDVDGDGHVGQPDLGILLTTYERPADDPLYDERADVNCDGAVNQSDLGLLLAVYGMDC